MNARQKERIARLEMAKIRAQLRGLAFIEPATIAEAIKIEASRPLKGGNRDMANTGLFGDAFKQKELF